MNMEVLGKLSGFSSGADFAVFLLDGDVHHLFLILK